MANETNLSVAIIEPHIGLFRSIRSVNNQAAAAAEAGANVIFIPMYTKSSECLGKAYESAKYFNPNIAVFSPTPWINKIFPEEACNPLSGLRYDVPELDSKGFIKSDLHILALFDKERIVSEPSVSDKVNPGGYLILPGNNENRAVLYKLTKKGLTIPVPPKSLEKRIKHCSLYDLIF
jgi:hypothetical protein